MIQVQAQPASCFFNKELEKYKKISGINLLHRNSQPQQNDCSHQHGRGMAQTAHII